MSTTDDTYDEPEADDDFPYLWFGQTPWDSMSRDELLRAIQRLYFAANEMHGALLQLRLGNERHWLWGPASIPTKGLAIGGAALDPYHRGNDQRSDIYHAFFQTAGELLFPGIICRGWHICDGCKAMTEQFGAPHDRVCFYCAYRKRTVAPMRPVEWRDMEPAAIEVHPATCADGPRPSDDDEETEYR